MQALRILKGLLPLLFCLKYTLCTVELTHNDLVCGQAALLNCSVNPFVDIRWDRNSALLVNCFTDGTCDVQSLGDVVFSLVSSNYILKIDPLPYSLYENNVFSCDDSSETAAITMDISVPLHTITISESSNVLTASTNCLKSVSIVTFNWTCVPSADSQGIGSNCNVSNITSATDATGCSAAGNNCLGAGLDKKTQVLIFENYTGPLAATTVNLVATATFGGVTVTATSTNAFTILETISSTSTRSIIESTSETISSTSTRSIIESTSETISSTSTRSIIESTSDVPTPSVVTEEPPCPFICCGLGIMLGVLGIASIVVTSLCCKCNPVCPLYKTPCPQCCKAKPPSPLHQDGRSPNDSPENGNVHLSEGRVKQKDNRLSPIQNRKTTEQTDRSTSGRDDKTTTRGLSALLDTNNDLVGKPNQMRHQPLPPLTTKSSQRIESEPTIEVDKQSDPINKASVTPRPQPKPPTEDYQVENEKPHTEENENKGEKRRKKKKKKTTDPSKNESKEET